MAIDVDTMEAGEQMETPLIANGQDKLPEETKKSKINWWLVLLNSTFLAVGTIGGPLLLRLYYLQGGSRKWLCSCLQTAGFPILLIPLLILYGRDRSRGISFLAEPKLLISSIVVGLAIGVDNFMYSEGASYLPVSTSSLLFSTQLAFTAFFAFLIVRQKFNHYSINAVVLMTLGAILLGIGKSSDTSSSVSTAQYLLGFILTLGAAAVLGLSLPWIELIYSKATKAITPSVVMQFQVGLTISATVFSTVGMLINKDFEAIPKEATEFGIGEANYYIVLVSTAVVFQLLYVGSLGLIFCTSSLFAGVVAAALLPLTEVAGVIFFQETFTGEKGLALALCLWGFASYFYGSYKKTNKPTLETESNTVGADTDLPVSIVST